MKNARPTESKPSAFDAMGKQRKYTAKRPAGKSIVADWDASQFIRRTFDGQPVRLMGADTCNSWLLVNAKDSTRNMRRAFAKYKRKVDRQGGAL